MTAGCQGRRARRWDARVVSGSIDAWLHLCFSNHQSEARRVALEAEALHIQSDECPAACP